MAREPAAGSSAPGCGLSCAAATLMTRAYWGSLFDPAYSPFPKKKKSNIHGVYDDDVSNAPARPHIASAGAGVPTSFGSAGGGGG